MTRSLKQEGSTVKVKRYAPIGRRLKATREVLGYCTATEFRELLGIESKAAWSYWETGEREIPTEIAIKICDKWDITLDWIYRGKLAGLRQDLQYQLAAAAGRRAVLPAGYFPRASTVSRRRSRASKTA